MKKVWTWFRGLKWYWQALIIIFLIGMIANILSPTQTQKSGVGEKTTVAEKPAKQESRDEKTKDKPSTVKQEKQIAEPQPIELSGIGQQATQKFALEDGLSIFRMTHNGASHFGIWLMDSNGEKVELLANETGIFNGAKAVGISKKGEYILDVSADGQWTVKIEQPRPTTADSKPKTFTGVGQSVSPFIKLDKGLTVFKLKHTGKSHFGIWLMDKNGNKEELLVNETGNFDGSKAVGIRQSEIYLMDISADGDWSISIE